MRKRNQSRPDEAFAEEDTVPQRFDELSGDETRPELGADISKAELASGVPVELEERASGRRQALYEMSAEKN